MEKRRKARARERMGKLLIRSFSQRNWNFPSLSHFIVFRTERQRQDDVKWRENYKHAGLNYVHKYLRISSEMRDHKAVREQYGTEPSLIKISLKSSGWKVMKGKMKTKQKRGSSEYRIIKISAFMFNPIFHFRDLVFSSLVQSSGLCADVDLNF